MPTYTFRCRTCGEVFTRRYSFHDDLSEVTCPQGHREVERVFVPPAIIFKGSGFYVTDHRGGNHKSYQDKAPSSSKKEKQASPSSSAGKQQTTQPVGSSIAA